MINNNRDSLFNRYLEELKIKGYRMQGIIGLKSRVPRLFEYLDEEDICLNRLGVKEAQSYQGWLIERGRNRGCDYSTRTISSYIYSASNFYEYLKENGNVMSNPFKEIKKIRVDKILPKNILKEKEMGELLDKLERYNNAGSLKNRISAYRLHVISELMYSSGLRITEAANLKVEDVDCEKGIVMVMDGKGGRERLAWLNEYASNVLRLYIKKMRHLVLNDWHIKNRGLLFGTGWRTFGRVVNRQLKKNAGEFGFINFTSHGFRHALGYHLLRAGCKIRYIQEILGHKLLRNTEVYTKVDKEDLKNVLDKYHPRRWIKR